MMSQPIYRTVFQVEVFSRGPFVPDEDNPEDPWNLEAINQAIVYGDCIGEVGTISTEVVPDEKVVDELVRIGNDGSFFEDPFDD